MAEFRLECFNKFIMNGENPLKEKDVILSDDWCEECQQWKKCVVVIKPKTLRGRLERTYNVTKINLRFFIEDLKKRNKKSRYYTKNRIIT